MASEPSWEHVKIGDVITIERGIEGREGYQRQTMRPATEVLIETFRNCGWHLVRIDRKNTAPGQLLLASSGLYAHDGTDDIRTWANLTKGDMFNTFESRDELDVPVAVVPVPLDAFKILAAELGNGPAADFIGHTRREWKRAGLTYLEGI